MTDALDIKIDINDMTLAELEKLEELTETAWRNIDWESMPLKAMRALVYIFGLRTDPNFTMEDAGNVRVLQVFAPRQPAQEVDETDPTRLRSVNGVA